MNENVINERISSYFEPKPTEPAGIFDPSILAVTPKGAWKFNFTEWVWQPLDYFTSEDASARLLEAMPYVRVEHAVKWVVAADLRKQLSIHGDAEHEDRKTAVVLAFLEFAGIAHKRDGGEGA